MNKNTDLPFGFYFWLPLLLALSPYILQSTLGRVWWLYGERGTFEILTFVLLVVAVYFILRAGSLAFTLHINCLPAWLLVMLLGSVYFAGEEISWGQHFFRWQTPQIWQGVNDQQETNLHNVHALFDQLPRTLLTFAALIGGILVPFYRWRRDIQTDVNEVSGWLWPTLACAPVCTCALGISLLDDLIESLFESSNGAVFAQLDISGGEMKECLLALFILFYSMSLYKRLKFHGVL